jgi:hypothetical protein
MDESRAVLERLARIEALDAAAAPAGLLLDELRALLVEAEAWSRREGGDAGERAVAELRRALFSAQNRSGPAPASVAQNDP